MHYYKRNIGDYHKKAGRLSILQHGIYMLLMDAIYDREKFPTKAEAIEWVWASTAEEIEATGFVLQKFFTNGNGIYKQKRIQEEINAFHSRSEINTRIAIERETKRAKQRTKRARNDHESPPNHKPLTTNQLKNNVPTAQVKTPRSFPVPAQEIVNKWNEFALANNLPQVVKVTNTLRGQIRQRWADIPSLEKWDNFFSHISASNFLSGKVPASNGRSKPFRSTLLWITKETNFAKIAAGEYD